MATVVRHTAIFLSRRYVLVGSLRLLQVETQFILWGIVATPLQNRFDANEVAKFMLYLRLTQMVDELWPHARLQQTLQFLLRAAFLKLFNGLLSLLLERCIVLIQTF